MAYRIEYSSGTAKKTAVTKEIIQKNKTNVLVVVLAILFCVTLYNFGRDRMYEALIPGDPAVTTAAAAKFVEDVRWGVSITDAFGTFCKEIIHGAIY